MGYPPIECINGGSQKSRWKSYIGAFRGSKHISKVFDASLINSDCAIVLALRDVCARVLD